MSDNQHTPSSTLPESVDPLASHASPGGRPGAIGNSGARLCAPLPGGRRPAQRKHALSLCPDGVPVRELIARVLGTAA